LLLINRTVHSSTADEDLKLVETIVIVIFNVACVTFAFR